MACFIFSLVRFGMKSFSSRLRSAELRTKYLPTHDLQVAMGLEFVLAIQNDFQSQVSVRQTLAGKHVQSNIL